MRSKLHVLCSGAQPLKHCMVIGVASSFAAIAHNPAAVTTQTERAIRFHYSNCAALNADFDGDEINVHLLQDDPSRAEAMTIMDADAQFCVPTDG